MATTLTLTMKVKTRWWFTPYLDALRWLHERTGFVPSEAHIRRIARFAISVRADRGKTA